MKRQILVFLRGIAAAALAGGLLATTVQAAPAPATNLLTNGGFEDTFVSGVASGWTKWVVSGSPIFQSITTSQAAARVAQGVSAQQLEVSNGTYTAGIQQTVTGLTAGATYRFTLSAHAWANSSDDSAASSGSITLKAGIGQGNAFASDAGNVWASAQYVNSYGTINVEAVAIGTSITVFTFASTTVSLKHNDAYFDNAALVVLSASTATPAASAATPVVAAAPVKIAPTNFAVPTADASGQQFWVVQPGDTLIHIASIVCGDTPECLEKLKSLNPGVTRMLSLGQKIIVGQADTALIPATPAAAAETPTPDPAVTAVVAEVTATVAAEPTVEPTAEALPTEAPSGAICVQLYDDLNGNGVLDAGEGQVKGGVFTITDTGSSKTLGTYTTGEKPEPYCFEKLQPANYRIALQAPAGYLSTTRVEWDLTLAMGSTANLEFGAQLGGAAPTPTAVAGAAKQPAWLGPLVGALGAMLLLGGAGLAGYLLLTRRR